MPKVKKKCNNDLFIILAVLGAVYAVFLAIVFKINGYIWFQNESYYCLPYKKITFNALFNYNTFEMWQFLQF